MPILLGVPLDVNSSYLRGPAGAPGKIREALRSDASNQWSELGIDVGAKDAFEDAGDLQLRNSREEVGRDFAEIERAVDELVRKGRRPVSLGGDHSVTYPIVKAFASHYADLSIIHFDAHPDLYDEFEGSQVSHACPFARIKRSCRCQLCPPTSGSRFVGRFIFPSTWMYLIPLLHPEFRIASREG